MKKIIMLSIALLAMLCASPADAQIKSTHKRLVTVDESKEKPGGAWLGVMLRTVDEEVAEDEHLDVKKGVFVEEVVDDSPADSAGIKENDVIIECGGKAVESGDDVRAAVKKAGVGAKLSLVVMRGSEKKTFEVVLGKARVERKVITRTMRVPSMGVPGAPPGAPQAPNAPQALNAPQAPRPPRTPFMQMFGGSGSMLGMKLHSLDSQLAAYFGAPDAKGVLVESVKKDSKAEKAGFKAGDVIIKAGKKTVTREGDLHAVLGAYDKGEKIPVDIIRRGSKQSLTIEAEEPPAGGHRLEFNMDGDDDSPRFFHFRGGDGEEGDFDFDLDGLKMDLRGINEDLPHMLDGLDGNIRIEVQRGLDEARRSLLRQKDELKKVKVQIRDEKEI